MVFAIALAIPVGHKLQNAMRLGLYLFVNAGSLIDAIFCCFFCAFQSYLIQQCMSGIFGVVTGFCAAVFWWNLQLKPPPQVEFALQFLVVDITLCLEKLSYSNTIY
jgi:hypothetical protein